MCHDGAFPDSGGATVIVDSHKDSTTLSENSDTADDEQADIEQAADSPRAVKILQYRLDLRRMIYSIMDDGFNVALINSLEFRDTKVIFFPCWGP